MPNQSTLSYWAARASMRILELENRCTGNRTVGSNPTLSANWSDFLHSKDPGAGSMPHPRRL